MDFYGGGHTLTPEEYYAANPDELMPRSNKKIHFKGRIIPIVTYFRNVSPPRTTQLLPDCQPIQPHPVLRRKIPSIYILLNQFLINTDRNHHIHCRSHRRMCTWGGHHRLSFSHNGGGSGRPPKLAPQSTGNKALKLIDSTVSF